MDQAPTELETELMRQADVNRTTRHSIYNTCYYLYYMTLGYIFDYNTHLKYRTVSAVAWQLAVEDQ
jgi:hypothetical protein